MFVKYNYHINYLTINQNRTDHAE